MSTCETCDWWNSHNSNDFGFCRRNPPVLIRSEGLTKTGHPRAFWGWPSTVPDNYCGEHSDFSGGSE